MSIRTFRSVNSGLRQSEFRKPHSVFSIIHGNCRKCMFRHLPVWLETLAVWLLRIRTSPTHPTRMQMSLLLRKGRFRCSTAAPDSKVDIRNIPFQLRIFLQSQRSCNRSSACLESFVRRTDRRCTFRIGWAVGWLWYCRYGTTSNRSNPPHSRSCPCPPISPKQSVFLPLLGRICLRESELQSILWLPLILLRSK